MTFTSEDDAWDLGCCNDHEVYDEDDWYWDHDLEEYTAYLDFDDRWYDDFEPHGGSDNDWLDSLANRFAATHIGQADTTIVYRAAIVGQSWDGIESHKSPTDARVKYQMRACSDDGDRSLSELEQHIRMGWRSTTRSSYISFTTDPNWAAYYVLLRENGGQVRQLLRLKVPTSQLIAYGGGDSTCRAFTKTASELFAHRFIDIYDCEELCVDEQVRKSSMVWFAKRNTYPFAEWLADN